MLSEYDSRAMQPKQQWFLLKASSTKAQEIFSWIAEPGRQEEIHAQRRAERLAGTCEWFLNTKEYRSWLQGPSYTSDEAILWCQGRPGIGKTMLA